MGQPSSGPPPPRPHVHDAIGRHPHLHAQVGHGTALRRLRKAVPYTPTNEGPNTERGWRAPFVGALSAVSVTGSRGTSVRVHCGTAVVPSHPRFFPGPGVARASRRFLLAPWVATAWPLQPCVLPQCQVRASFAFAYAHASRLLPFVSPTISSLVPGR